MLGDVSFRQEPVIESLIVTLDLAKAQARAILDNAYEENRSLPSELLSSFNNDLCRIQAALETATCVK
tara:strand:+ start:551 stop:754 length:204 start_codon:yes stop_codon:yes gene_type:complete